MKTIDSILFFEEMIAKAQNHLYGSGQEMSSSTAHFFSGLFSELYSEMLKFKVIFIKDALAANTPSSEIVHRTANIDPLDISFKPLWKPVPEESVFDGTVSAENKILIDLLIFQGILKNLREPNTYSHRLNCELFQTIPSRNEVIFKIAMEMQFQSVKKDGNIGLTISLEGIIDNIHIKESFNNYSNNKKWNEGTHIFNAKPHYGNYDESVHFLGNLYVNDVIDSVAKSQLIDNAIGFTKAELNEILQNPVAFEQDCHNRFDNLIESKANVNSSFNIRIPASTKSHNHAYILNLNAVVVPFGPNNALDVVIHKLRDEEMVSTIYRSSEPMYNSIKENGHIPLWVKLLFLYVGNNNLDTFVYNRNT